MRRFKLALICIWYMNLLWMSSGQDILNSCIQSKQQIREDEHNGNKYLEERLKESLLGESVIRERMQRANASGNENRMNALAKQDPDMQSD